MAYISRRDLELGLSPAFRSPHHLASIEEARARVMDVKTCRRCVEKAAFSRDSFVGFACAPVVTIIQHRGETYGLCRHCTELLGVGR